MSDSVLRLLSPDTKPALPPAQLTMLDEAFWGDIQHRVEANRLRSQRSMAVQGFDSLSGQSVREDYTRAFDDLYGMRPCVDTEPKRDRDYLANPAKWLPFDRLAYALNRIVDLNAGKTEPQRIMVEDEWEPIEFHVTKTKPIGEVNHVLDLVSLCLTGSVLGLPQVGWVAPVPRWRLNPDRRTVDYQSTRIQNRPTKVHWEVRDVPLAPERHNPYQVEGGFTPLDYADYSNLNRQGVEGLTVLIDQHDRMSLVHWVNASFPHIATRKDGKRFISNWVAKRPLAVHEFTLDTPEEDAIREMSAVRAAMCRTLRYYDDDPIQGIIYAEDRPQPRLLPWQAAAMQELDAPTDTHLLYFEPSKIQAIAEQRDTHATYRNWGAGPDTDE